MLRNHSFFVAPIAALALALFWLGSGFASEESGVSSEFAERVLALEFSDDPTPEFSEIARREHVPLQRVPRDAEGLKLASERDVREYPTCVLLVDGREFGRVSARDKSSAEIRSELTKLVASGRAETAKRPRKVERAPRKPLFGLLFKSRPSSGSTARGQIADPDYRFEPREQAPVARDDERLTRLSDAIGLARVGAASARIVVSDADGGSESSGPAAAIHYNEEFREALFVASSKLFEKVGSDSVAPKVVARIFSPIDGSREDAVGQCVYCDPQLGLALVAARASRPATPVAFLPKQAGPKVGEEIREFSREGEELRASVREVLAVNKRRFYRKEGAVESGSVLYDQLSGARGVEGSGCFVSRNGRFYFAGILGESKGEDEQEMIPVDALSQALLSNSSLAAVYRDQIAGKFDAPATSEEIEFANKVLASAPEETALAAKPAVPTPTVPEAAPEASAPEGAPREVAANNAPESLASPQPAPGQVPYIVAARTPDGERVQLAPSAPGAADPRAVYFQVYAAPGGVRSASHESSVDPEELAAYEREEEAFNAALETLRRRALDGAEIVCIVNWSGDAKENAPRDSEVIRLPRRKIPVNPAATKNRVELVAIPVRPGAPAPEPSTPEAEGQTAPLTAEIPGSPVAR